MLSLNKYSSAPLRPMCVCGVVQHKTTLWTVNSGATRPRHPPPSQRALAIRTSSTIRVARSVAHSRRPLGLAVLSCCRGCANVCVRMPRNAFWNVRSHYPLGRVSGPVHWLKIYMHYRGNDGATGDHLRCLCVCVRFCVHPVSIEYSESSAFFFCCCWRDASALDMACRTTYRRQHVSLSLCWR